MLGNHSGHSIRRTMTDVVVDHISTQIRDGVYKIGDKLPNEDELALEIGVGRSSVREGMKVLKVYGVVEIRQGGGTFVTDNVAEHMFDFLWFMSGSTYLNFLEFRRVIEVGAIVEIYDKLQEKDFEELQKLVDCMVYGHSLDDLVQADHDFHHKLNCFNNNPLNEQIEKMLYQVRIDSLYKVLCRAEDVEITRAAHQRILDALRARDLAECIDAVLSHLDYTITNIKRDTA